MSMFVADGGIWVAGVGQSAGAGVRAAGNGALAVCGHCPDVGARAGAGMWVWMAGSRGPLVS